MLKDIIKSLIFTLVVLAVPFIGNIYVEGWNWEWYSFFAAGGFIFFATFVYRLVSKRVNKLSYKLGVGVGIFTAFVLVWGTLAVGFIGEENTANIFYLFMPPAGLLAAIVVRFKPKAMSWIMFSMAGFQLIVPVLAIVFWNYDFAPGFLRVMILSVGFASMFAFSGALFREAARV